MTGPTPLSTLAGDLERAMLRAKAMGVSDRDRLHCIAQFIGYMLANGTNDIDGINQGLGMAQVAMVQAAQQVFREQHPHGLENTVGTA